MSTQEDLIINKYKGHGKGFLTALFMASFTVGTVGWIYDWDKEKVADIDPKVTTSDSATYLSGWPFVPQLKSVTQSYNAETGELCRTEDKVTAPLFIPAGKYSDTSCKKLDL